MRLVKLNNSTSGTDSEVFQVGGEYTRGNRNEGAYANKAGLIITGMGQEVAPSDSCMPLFCHAR